MGYEPGKFISAFRRALACLWVTVGLWVVYSYLRHFDSVTVSAIPALTVGAAIAICAVGYFFDKRWGRISIGCLMALVVLVSADLLLFIALRGLDGRQLLLGVAVALVVASICTWSVLAATRTAFYFPQPSNHASLHRRV